MNRQTHTVGVLALFLVLFSFALGCGSAEESVERPTVETAERVRDMVQLPDGRLATLTREQVVIYEFGDVVTNTTVGVEAPGSSLRAPLFVSPDGDLLAALSWHPDETQSVMIVWDAAGIEPSQRVPLPQYFKTAVFTGTSFRGIASRVFLEIDLDGDILRELNVPVGGIDPTDAAFVPFESGYRASSNRILLDPWASEQSDRGVEMRELPFGQVFAASGDSLLLKPKLEPKGLRWYRNPLSSAVELPVPRNVSIEQIVDWVLLSDDAIVVLVSSARKTDFTNAGSLPKSLLVYERKR